MDDLAFELAFLATAQREIKHQIEPLLIVRSGRFVLGMGASGGQNIPWDTLKIRARTSSR